MQRSVLILAVMLGVGWMLPPAAQAVPSFSKQTGIACSGCHVAYPTLNETGRQFKKNGYRMGDVADRAPQQIGGLTLNGEFPLSARIVGRFADNKQTAPTKLDNLHELEIFLAGHPAQGISAFAEFEGEDEDGFVMGLKAGVVGWHPSPAFNILTGYAPLFFADPYDTLADGGRRMTADHKGILDLGERLDPGAGATGNKQRLRDPVQQLNLTGQVGPVWYLAGISGGGKSSTLNSKKNGADPDDFQARLAVDLPSNLMLGGFYYGGTDTLDNGKDDFTLYGFDLRHDNAALGASVLAATLWSEDDVAGAVDEVYGGYVEVLRPFDLNGHTLVPLVRYNWADGDGPSAAALESKMRKTTLLLGYYPQENARLSVEFTHFDEVVDNQRLVVAMDVAF